MNWDRSIFKRIGPPPEALLPQPRATASLLPNTALVGRVAGTRDIRLRVFSCGMASWLMLLFIISTVLHIDVMDVCTSLAAEHSPNGFFVVSSTNERYSFAVDCLVVVVVVTVNKAQRMLACVDIAGGLAFTYPFPCGELI